MEAGSERHARTRARNLVQLLSGWELNVGSAFLLTPATLEHSDAVVTELFFERPRELRAEHPELYDEFRQYYRQDPAARRDEAADGP